MDDKRLPGLLNRTLSATYASYMLRLAENRGISAENLLQNTDLAAAQIHQQNARISSWQQAYIVENLIRLSNDPGIAIEIGLRSNLTKAGFIGYGLMSCSTLREAIELGRRFLPIQLPFFKLEFATEGDMAVVTVKEVLPLLRLRHFAIENFLIEVSEIFRGLLLAHTKPDKYELLELYFDYAEPDYFAPYKARLPKLHFSQPANQFRFPARLLDKPIHTANPAMTQLVVQQGVSEMARLGLLEDWMDRLQALLVCQQQRYPDLPALAAQLHMSERTLKRKLAERGLSFSSMLEEVMKRDAMTLLNDASLSVQDIAMRLGYQDRANFTRAFRRWTGQTPSDYRQQHSGYMA